MSAVVHVTANDETPIEWALTFHDTRIQITVDHTTAITCTPEAARRLSSTIAAGLRQMRWLAEPYNPEAAS